jgi:hypothetical protein
MSIIFKNNKMLEFLANELINTIFFMIKFLLKNEWCILTTFSAFFGVLWVETGWNILLYLIS